MLIANEAPAWAHAWAAAVEGELMRLASGASRPWRLPVYAGGQAPPAAAWAGCLILQRIVDGDFVDFVPYISNGTVWRRVLLEDS